MATRALDVVTIMHALSVLDGELKTKGWDADGELAQELFVSWMETYKDQIASVKGLKAKASNLYEVLNAYLVEHKFDPMIDPFEPSDHLGVVSILDKLVNWQSGPGEVIQIQTSGGPKPGFELPASDVNVYYVDGYPGSHLLELKTKTRDTLWLFVHGDKSIEGLALAKLSMDVMGRKRTIPFVGANHGVTQLTFGSAHVPMIDFDIKPDISWLKGLFTQTEDGHFYVIDQAKQQFKMRMDETGARVKVATALVAKRLSMPTREPAIFVVDQPFYGWWTQKGTSLPMAAFFADWDSMKKPAGTLAEL